MSANEPLIGLSRKRSCVISQSTTRWGIIAPGRIAHAFAAGIQEISTATIVAVASRDDKRGQEFAQLYGIPRVYQDYASLLCDPNIDAVYIANPHRYHYGSIREALLQGKSVLCEKPLTVTAAETQSLTELAKHQGVFLMEALWTRYLPLWQEAKRLINSGAIGTVLSMESSFGFKIARDPDDRLLNKSLAGGVLLDMGIYPISLSGFIAQDAPALVHSQITIGSTGVDEHVEAEIAYGNIVSHMSCSFLKRLDNTFLITGSSGSLVIQAPFWAATDMRLTKNDGTVIAVHKPYQASGFQFQIQSAMDAMSKGLSEEPTNPWQDTHQNQTLMDTLLAKAGIDFDFAKR